MHNGAVIHERTLDWLLEANNPGVRIRTLTGLCGLPVDDTRVVSARKQVTRTLKVACDLSWMKEKGTNGIKYLTALAEAGLQRHNVPIDPVVDRYLGFDASGDQMLFLRTLKPFGAGCGEIMLLRALVMLGYGDDHRVGDCLTRMAEMRLADGGWLCLPRLAKMEHTPKSCMKANMHALLLAGELVKRGMPFPGVNELIGYFLKRRLFYRTDDPQRLVIEEQHPGWRMTDAFFPIEFHRVGLPTLLEALATLGAGQAPELQEAWSMLDAKFDAQGRVTLDGTLTKSYLPKEQIGRPSKWATLYAWLAYKARCATGGMIL